MVLDLGFVHHAWLLSDFQAVYIDTTGPLISTLFGTFSLAVTLQNPAAQLIYPTISLLSHHVIPFCTLCLIFSIII
jgi:hypothetical protein